MREVCTFGNETGHGQSPKYIDGGMILLDSDVSPSQTTFPPYAAYEVLASFVEHCLAKGQHFFVSIRVWEMPANNCDLRTAVLEHGQPLFASSLIQFCSAHKLSAPKTGSMCLEFNSQNGDLYFGTKRLLCPQIVLAPLALSRTM